MRPKQLEWDEKEDFIRQFERNGRWGTCVDCPEDPYGYRYPEKCANFSRYDHKLGLRPLIMQVHFRWDEGHRKGIEE